MEIPPKVIGNELEPLEVRGSKFLKEVLLELDKNHDKVKPVIFINPETGQIERKCYYSLVFEDNLMFIQAEGYYDVDMQSPWQKVQPGIFRFPLRRE